MAGDRFYLDTSAYLCILLGESGSRRLERELIGGRLVSSALLVLEANRNLVRLGREGVLDSGALRSCLDRVERDIEVFSLRELTLDLCCVAPMPVVLTPRSLDLAHVRTALWFHGREPLRRFVTLDRAQAEVAKDLGLPV